MKKVIITGANGFIGRKLCNFFSEKNYEVFALIQNKSDHSQKVVNKNINFIDFSLEDTEAIIKNLPSHVDCFYHLAWDGVSTEYKNDALKQLKNIEYSLAIMNIAKKVGADKVIMTGSVSECAYSTKKVDGSLKPIPSDYYGAAKASTRIFCDLFARQHNMQFHWTYISSIYGPGRIDQNLITYTIISLLKNRVPQFTKLEQLWDYIYIDDLINALYCIGLKGKKNQDYAIGSGDVRSLREYVEIIRHSINEESLLGIGAIPYKTEQIDNSIVDISLLKRDTGFNPSVSFEQGIQFTIDFIRKYLEAYNE